MTTDDHGQRRYWETEHGFRTWAHPVARCFARQRVREITPWIDLHAVRRALDVGCGDGLSTAYVSEVIPDVHATDRSEFLLRRHPLRGTGKVVQADARSLPYPQRCFDLVYGWEVLHHVPEPTDVLREMARVSRRYVLVAEPNVCNPAQLGLALCQREHRWVLKYTLGYLCRTVSAAGLRVVRAATGGWIFPNKTPKVALALLLRLPYWWPLGITNWVLGEKPE